MKFLRSAFAAVSLGAFLAFTACASDQVVHNQNEQIEISFSWWGNDARNEYTISALEMFQELNPNIKVNYSYSEWSGYEARSRVQMISATEADVMQVNFGWLSEYSPDGTGYYDIEQLTDTVDLSCFSPDILDYGRKNGVLNAIPIAMNAETVYINKTIYESYGLDIPQTWDDIFAAAKVMSKDGIYPLACVSKAVWLYSVTYAEQTTGKTFLTDDGRINYSTDELAVLLDFYVRLVQEEVIPQVENYSRNDITNRKYAGAVAWVSDAVNYFGGVIEKGDEIIAADYTAFSPDASGEGWYAKPAQLYAISCHTEHPKEAAMLLNYLLNSREMALMQGVDKGIPLSSDAQKFLDEEGLLSGIQYDASLVMDRSDKIAPMSPVIENSDLIDDFIDAANLVLYDKAELDEAAQQLYDTYAENYDMAN